MFLKIGILLIPLLANSHIFEIIEEFQPYTMIPLKTSTILYFTRV
jgi:hypothetical protein